MGYESNLQKNDRKQAKYRDLIAEQSEHFKSVKFVNLSISSLGVFSKECQSFLKMLNDLGFDKKHQMFCIRKIILFNSCKHIVKHFNKVSILILLLLSLKIYKRVDICIDNNLQ